MFLSLWQDAYLLALRERNAEAHQGTFLQSIKVDDVVVIKHPAKTKPFWQLARIVKVHPGSDGLIRSVTLRRTDGDEVLMSIKHLFPLELQADDEAIPQMDGPPSRSHVTPSPRKSETEPLSFTPDSENQHSDAPEPEPLSRLSGDLTPPVTDPEPLSSIHDGCLV